MRHPTEEGEKRKEIGVNEEEGIKNGKIEGYELLEKIGSGGFADVFKARSIHLNSLIDFDKYYAIKRISKESARKKRCEQKIIEEIKIHSQLEGNPAIVKFEEYLEDEKYWYLVLEFCEGGSLEKLLKCKRYLSEEEALPLIKEIFQGILYLHLKGVIHRDLSLRNILLTKNGNVKIADFGFAVECHSGENVTSVLGTRTFMAPEVVNRCPYGFKADIWSLGIILYILLYGAHPFKVKGENNSKCVSNYKITFPEHASKEARELLEEMLTVNEEKRIDIKEALKHKFFQKYEKRDYKYENNNHKRGDSGFSSVPSSSSKSSQSVKKTKVISNRRRPNDFENIIYAEMPSCEVEGQRVRSTSKCKPKKCVPDSVNQLKCKIQPLPSRHQVNETDLSLHMNPQERREYNYKDRGKRETAKEINTESGIVTHDNRGESQFEMPIRDCPATPLYPTELQNLNEDKISNYSCYNKVESIKYCENRIAQNYCITSNSQDDISKYSSCSHDNYCPPENNCHHKSSCCCHQCPISVTKSKNNSTCFHKSHEKENRSVLGVRNHTVAKSLKETLTPLTTTRLKPIRLALRNVIVSILDDKQVCAECIKLNREKNYLTLVIFISEDGKKVTVYKPKKKILPSDDKPPPLPINLGGVHFFSIENLPEIYWNKYKYAKRVVDIVRASTAKVTIYGKDAMCRMMENDPNPDYEMKFYDGFQIKEKSGKITITDQDGKQLMDNNKCDINTEHLLNVFLNMKEKCNKSSKALLSIHGDAGFPVIIGSLPEELKSKRENASPRSMCSSSLNGTIATMKSDIGTNTDCSPYSNFSQICMPSLYSEDNAMGTQFKIISKVLPNLKSPPWVVKGWIIAEYKDDIQMWISTCDKEVFFLDSHKKKLPCEKHPDLMKRYIFDSKNVLKYASSREVERTK